MRNLLALIGAAVVGFGGLGWYLGWYKLHVSKAADGNVQIQADVDQKKVVQDVGDGAKHLGQLAGDQLEKAQKDGTPANTPGPVSTPQGKADYSWLPGLGATGK